jgi:hypothetical protein
MIAAFYKIIDTVFYIISVRNVFFLQGWSTWLSYYPMKEEGSLCMCACYVIRREIHVLPWHISIVTIIALNIL